MDTIPELPAPSDDLNNNKSQKNAISTNVTSSSSSSSIDSQPSLQSNGKPKTTPEKELSIVQHIKHIEKIDEKRRIFLANTLGESTVNALIITEDSNDGDDTKKPASPKSLPASSPTIPATTTPTVSIAKITHETAPPTIDRPITNGILRPESITSRSAKSLTLPLKSPITPPPKPPMLSRTRSVGVGDDKSARSPPLRPAIRLTPTQSPTLAGINRPTIETLPLNDDTPVLRRMERPLSTAAATSTAISENHYERLIEELKCPGCAAPMRAPILLCQTGHSICEQCTRVLLMCPLCKEPFTNMRSLTLEALCSKAHFRCSNAAGGCTVRLQYDLLNWHEKQCIFKPMKCFMGRVWGNCEWNGREAYWKEHLETEHKDKVFTTKSMDLLWNMAEKQKPLSGYYVFEVYDEMFNFYQIYDKERVLFTMTCTSTMKDKKLKYAFEVTLHQPDNEALAITQKYPMHSEYDSDILAEGTCASFTLTDLSKFQNEDKLLCYRVRILEVNPSRKTRNSSRSTTPNGTHQINFQQTQIEGANLKSVSSEIIVTRRESAPTTPSSMPKDYDGSGSESDPEFEAYIAKKWGTPQLNFNRKFLAKPASVSSSSNDETSSQSKNLVLAKSPDDKTSVCSTSTNYKQKVASTLRKSFRSLKTDLINTKQFLKRSPEKKNEK